MKGEESSTFSFPSCSSSHRQAFCLTSRLLQSSVHDFKKKKKRLYTWSGVWKKKKSSIFKHGLSRCTADPACETSGGLRPTVGFPKWFNVGALTKGSLTRMTGPPKPHSSSHQPTYRVSLAPGCVWGILPPTDCSSQRRRRIKLWNRLFASKSCTGHAHWMQGFHCIGYWI